jgi:uncharacterized protein (TIGR03083 family)
MGDIADVYDDVRKGLSALVLELSDDERHTPVPATPGWTIRDVIAHLAGDAACLIVGDLPREFFDAFGDDDTVVTLNRWTSGHVTARAETPISEVLDEWEESAGILTRMMRGESAWPNDIPFFADRVLVTDIGVHQHDIYGALGIVRDRGGPPVRIGVAGYVAILDMRFRTDGVPPLRLEADEKIWVVGGDEPAATLRTNRFELFRALSGRRSPEQVKGYDWDGKPDDFMRYFYPYGVRAEALIE